MKAAKPTIHTIAQMTGLSLATVSRALAGSASVQADTRDRVLEAAKAVNYVRDRAAVRLKTGRTQVIAFIMDQLDVVQPAFEALLRGLGDALRDTDYHLIVLPDADAENGLTSIEYVVERGMADGVVFTHTSANDPRVRLLHERGFPFITHGRTDLPFVHPSVDFANEAFAADAVRVLFGRGRKRPCILLPKEGGMFREHLIRGFERACRDASVEGLIVTEVDLDAPPEAIHAWMLDNARAVDGVIVTLEAPMLPVLSALDRARRRVGRDVDVVVKHRSPLPRYVRESIFVCFEDVRLAGQTLGRCLLDQLANPSLAPRQILFSPPAIEMLHEQA